MTFVEWSPKDVEYRILEAAETLMLCPAVSGPQQYGSALPEPVRKQEESYSYSAARYRRQPSPDALDRMEMTWEWINELSSDDDRRLIYNWSYFKVRKGFRINSLIDGMSYSRSVFYRQLQRIFADIAENLNKKHIVQLTAGQIDQKMPPNHVNSPKLVQRKDNAWMSPDAKPCVDPKLPRKRIISV